MLPGTFTNSCGIGRGPAVRGYPRRQQVQAPRRSVVVTLELVLLGRRNQQDLGGGRGVEHRPLPGREVAVAARQPVPPGTPLAGLVGEAGIGGEVDVQAWHPVEADDPVYRVRRQVRLHPAQEAPVAPHVGERGDRHQAQVDIRRQLPLPNQAVNPAVVATALQLGGDAGEIPL